MSKTFQEKVLKPKVLDYDNQILRRGEIIDSIIQSYRLSQSGCN